MLKKYKLVRILIVITILGLILSGCAKTEVIEENNELENKNVYPLTVVDSYGNEVVLDESPSRVISVAPSITETLYALGVEEFLVGRTDYCDYPAEASNIESIGTLRQPNIEQIIKLEPDLIIASTHFKEDAMKKLNELNLNIIVLDPRDSFEGVYGTIEKIGQIFNINDKADELVSDMKQRVGTIVDKVKDKEKPSVYYVVGFGESGDYTAGGDTFINDMIDMAGGINAAKEVNGWKYNIERLVEQDPDMLVVSKNDNSRENIVEANGYKDLTAVKEGRVFEIDNNLLDRQGPRLVQGLEDLAEIINPDLFQ